MENASFPFYPPLLARSGCVTISGGLEVASDRLLTLMMKGVTVEQVARVTRAFTDAGVMVHAYLMYGFPTETAHSPIGKAPELFGIELLETEAPTFARNDLAFTDPTGCDHDFYAEGLRTALYNYMHGMGLDADPRSWFKGKRGSKIPRTTVDPDLVRRALDA